MKRAVPSFREGKPRRHARGLVFDIETSPLITQQYKWGLWDERPIEEEIIQDWQMLSFAWQWVGETKIHVLGQDDMKGYKPGVLDDKALCNALWKLIDEADYIVAHNGDQFDMKKIRSRFVIHDFKPYSPVKQIDTKKMAKRIGGFTSNRLKDLAKATGSAQKGDPGGFSTWKGCMAGDKKAWTRMKKYNKQDIPPLLDLYLKFRPWDTNFFPLNVFDSRPKACPRCGQDSMIKSMKYQATNLKRYQYYRCSQPQCGGMAKSRIAEPETATERMEYKP